LLGHYVRQDAGLELDDLYKNYVPPQVKQELLVPAEHVKHDL